MCPATIEKTIGEKMKGNVEIIPVKNKNGVIVNKVVDFEKNEKNMDKVKTLMDNTTCYDIFYNAEIDGKRMIEKLSHQKKLQYKLQRSQLRK